MSKRLTIVEFFKRYPNEDTCLEHVMDVRYGMESKCPKCERDSTFSKITKRPAYACKFCGHHIYPMAGTPFESTRTPLQMWFYAIYLFTTSKHGVPAKELQRQLGVTYKTAWRMGHEIRKYMAIVDGDSGLGGDVEVDETYIGGREKWGADSRHPKSKKAVVFGMLQRGGEIIAKVVPDRKVPTLFPIIGQHIDAGSRVLSDDYLGYRKLKKLGYRHEHVNHKREEWVRGDVHTQTIEGFWSRLKLSIRGTHVHVSKKHLQKYVHEFEYRFNHRHLSSEQMLEDLLTAL